MKRFLPLTVALVALLAAGLSAQSSLVSIFDKYTVNPKWVAAWDAYTSGVAADGKGQVIVLVRQVPHFRLFTTAGQPVRQWGDAGIFTLAHSVHYGPDGALWATDPDGHAIYKFGPDGKVVLTLGTKGVTGDDTSTTSFNRPNAVGFGPNGDVYVSDGYNNARIVQFTADGKFVRIIGGKKGSGPGEMQTVHGVAIDAQGRIIVSDAGNKRLTIFGRDGVFIKSIPAPSWGGLVIAPDQTIYVSDVNAGVVSVIRNDQLVDIVKVDGRPHGLGVDPTTGDIYTSSTQQGMPNVTKSSPKPAK
jgi:hypothetical protein